MLSRGQPGLYREYCTAAARSLADARSLDAERLAECSPQATWFTSVPMALPWSSVVTGVGLSAVVGLFFGIYPAKRAAKLDPIEALRVER